jgi:hypothetical protein
MMTIEEKQRLVKLVSTYYTADKNNELIYFYKKVLNRNPPHCACEYGNMFFQLRNYVNANKNNLS